MEHQGERRARSFLYAYFFNLGLSVTFTGLRLLSHDAGRSFLSFCIVSFFLVCLAYRLPRAKKEEKETNDKLICAKRESV